MTRQISRLKLLKDSGYTRLELVKDIESGQYLVEKSLSVPIHFQEQLFANEIAVHSSLENRYIIRFIEQSGAFQFLMEYASHDNLGKVIEEGNKGGCDEKEWLKLSLQFLKGLDYLHGKGWVHNDIKPSNILIDKEGRARLADFAFTGPLGQVSIKNPPPLFKLGTDFFRGPHMTRGDLLNCFENDIYAVGVVLYMLFSKDGSKKTIQLERIGNTLVQKIVQECLSYTVQSIKPVLDRLENVLNGRI